MNQFCLYNLNDDVRADVSLLKHEEKHLFFHLQFGCDIINKHM